VQPQEQHRHHEHRDQQYAGAGAGALAGRPQEADRQDHEGPDQVADVRRDVDATVVARDLHQSHDQLREEPDLEQRQRGVQVVVRQPVEHDQERQPEDHHEADHAEDDLHGCHPASLEGGRLDRGEVDVARRCALLDVPPVRWWHQFVELSPRIVRTS
jgi:hypothetical protein